MFAAAQTLEEQTATVRACAPDSLEISGAGVVIGNTPQPL
jgi:hypothetical protein